MRSVIVFVAVVSFMALNVGASGEVVDEVRGGYITGGSASGATYTCLPDATGHDILAACHVRCPGGTCNITVIDDVRGTDILFRVCFDGETFCRPEGYIGHADVAGPKVTVVPVLDRATHGVVIVR